MVGADTSSKTVMLPCEGCLPDPPCYPEFQYCPNYWVACDVSISHDESPGHDSEGIGFTRVGFSGSISCRGSSVHLHPVAINAQAMLIDRTPGRDVTPLRFGNPVSGLVRHNNSLTSTGEIVLSHGNYPTGEHAEAAFELTAQLTGVHPSNVRQYCRGGDYNLLFCDGVWTQTIHGSWGSHTFATGVRMPECDNTEPPLDDLPPGDPDQEFGPIETTVTFTDCGTPIAGVTDTSPTSSTSILLRIICTSRSEPVRFFPRHHVDAHGRIIDQMSGRRPGCPRPNEPASNLLENCGVGTAAAGSSWVSKVQPARSRRCPGVVPGHLPSI
jgi:hypothetical protein